jgi:long-chain acyl-CoA synthetase
MPAVPTMLSVLLNHPEAGAYDLSSLREVVCGAAPLPVELARAFMDRHGCHVREVYGMTENAGIASANRRSHGYRPGSAGRACLGVELRIVDDDDRPVPAGVRGEIVTRGPTVMKGYYRRSDATAETLRGGFLHTGDIGYLDEEGYLYIVDRKKDMIIKGGENIYPAELEAVLHGHPRIAEAAVVGVPDAKYGETVIAFVAPKYDMELSESDVIGFLAERISKFKLPETVHIRSSLPKLGVGKILRRELRLEADKLRGKPI